MVVSEYEGIFTQIDEDGNEVQLYPIPKNGGIQIVAAESSDGVAYTATVKGVTELIVGMKITIIPNKVSNSLTPTLNVNGLGAKYIRMPGTYNTATCANGPVVSWLSVNKPVTVTWDGTQWETDIQRPTATSISGTVAIANGGTGATTADAALANLGGVPKAGTKITDVTQITTGGMYYSTDAVANAPVTDGTYLTYYASANGWMLSIICAVPWGNVYYSTNSTSDGTTWTNSGWVVIPRGNRVSQLNWDNNGYPQVYVDHSTWVNLATKDSVDGVAATANAAHTRAFSCVALQSYVNAGVDLNTVVTSGFYRLNSGHVNSPSSLGYPCDWGQLIVCQGGGDTIMQILVDFSTATMFIRSGNPSNTGGTGSWTAWRRVLTADDFTVSNGVLTLNFL